MCIGLTIVKWLSVYYGLVIYSTYHDCDPISTGVSNCQKNYE